MARYLDPKNDLVFKRIFGEHPHLLKSFLNALMPLEEGRHIESLEYLSPENVPENPLKKFTLLNVRCKDNRERQFIVAIQVQWSTIFPNKILRKVTRTIEKDSDYDTLSSVYGLGILNEPLDRKTPEFYHRYQMDSIEVVLVELPKFKPESIVKKKIAALWLRFLKEVKDGARVVTGDFLADKDISEAVTICEETPYTDAELYAYDRYFMDISNERSMLAASFKEGYAAGLAKVRAERLALAEQERLKLEQELSDIDKELEAKGKELEAKDKKIEELKRLLNKQ